MIFVFGNTPVDYHSFIYKRIATRFPLKVYFKSIHTAVAYYDKSVGAVQTPPKGLLDGYCYVDCSRLGWVKIILTLLDDFLCQKRKDVVIIIQGYDNFHSLAAFFIGILLRRRLFFSR